MVVWLVYHVTIFMLLFLCAYDNLLNLDSIPDFSSLFSTLVTPILHSFYLEHAARFEFANMCLRRSLNSEES